MRPSDGKLVSVVIPTHNRAYCVFLAIDSVRDQSHKNWEVVLVDDGSTDDTAVVISARYGNDPRVRYIYQTNAGVSAARNAGIRASRGDYVAFLDSDDVWKPWKLEVQLACFQFFPEVGMVWTNFEAVDAARNVVSPRFLTTMYRAYNQFASFENLFEKSLNLSDVMEPIAGPDSGARVYVGNIYSSMLLGNLVHTSTVMVSRERIEKVKEFDETLTLSGEDYDFHFRTCKGGEVCLVDVSSTEYQVDYNDQLTQYGKQVALNALKTVNQAIAREKGTGVFSSHAIDYVLAKNHAWAAQECLESNDYSGVRIHSLLSLRHKAWQPRLVLLFGVSILPRSLAEGILQTYRRSKSLVYRSTKA
jgi:GT2 family glycosyltransferase